MKNDKICDSREVSSILAINRQTARKLMREGLITPIGQAGHSNIYSIEDVLRVKERWFRDGYSHTDIANLYGVTRSAVMYWFARLGITPDGHDRRQHRTPAIYDLETVEYAAEQLGWERVSGANNGETPTE